ncbi:hypothetical protein [Ktedonobacter robiniae]|nr:hypothetical protein [Ktedonobacter robiniae]
MQQFSLPGELRTLITQIYGITLGEAERCLAKYILFYRFLTAPL